MSAFAIHCREKGANILGIFRAICEEMSGDNKCGHGLRNVPITVNGVSQTYVWAIALPVWGPEDATLKL